MQVAGGAQLSFTNYLTDSTLLEMNNPPPTDSPSGTTIGRSRRWGS